MGLHLLDLGKAMHAAWSADSIGSEVVLIGGFSINEVQDAVHHSN